MLIDVSQRLKASTFDEFYRDHYQLVYRTAFSLTHNREDAEDVCQIVFGRVLCHDDLAELAKNIKGYLYRSAIHEAWKLLQARKRQEALSDDGSNELLSESTTVLEDQMSEALRDAMQELKPEYLQILSLRYDEGCSEVEIAEKLGISRIKVAVSLFRARGQLKKLLHAAPGLFEERRVLTNEMTMEGELR
jgi:RNA polymerase sigma-70 factor (ECF subfamily)